VVVADGQFAPRDLFIARSHLVWRDDYSVYALARGAGPETDVVILANAVGQVRALASDQDSVFFMATSYAGNGRDNALLKQHIGAPAGSHAILVPNAFPAATLPRLAVGPRHVFWIGSGGAAPEAIRRVAKSGEGPIDVVYEDGWFNDGPVLSAHFAYWKGSDINIWRVPIEGGEAESLIGGPTAQIMGASEEMFYYLYKGSLYRLEESPGAAAVKLGPLLGASDGESSRRFAVDASGLYAAVEDEGEITRIHPGSGQSELLAAGQVGPLHIAVDESFVYWSTNTSIMRLVK
jgi:hypothetical protein